MCIRLTFRLAMIFKTWQSQGQVLVHFPLSLKYPHWITMSHPTICWYVCRLTNLCDCIYMV